MSICPSVHPSVCLSCHLSLNILVTTELIGFYSLGNIPTGPVVVSWGVGHPQSPEKQKNLHPPPLFFYFPNLQCIRENLQTIFSFPKIKCLDAPDLKS